MIEFSTVIDTHASPLTEAIALSPDLQESVYPNPLVPQVRSLDGFMFGNLWTGRTGDLDDSLFWGLDSDDKLAAVRGACRYIARQSPYAINGHFNRINYVIGTGHTYNAVVKKGTGGTEPLAQQAQEVIDEFCYRTRWNRRQKEMLLRRDRDGEAFVRLFKERVEGVPRTTIRFVEPGEIHTPTGELSGDHHLGIHVADGDVETVLGYWIEGDYVPASQIQHRKGGGVDANLRRGVPLFWPVIPTLGQIKTVRRNMSAASSIQTSVAMVKKVDASAGAIDGMRDRQAPLRGINPNTGGTRYVEDYSTPGKILTTSSKVDHVFPWAGVNYSTYVEVIADNLREVAALIRMPEFMLTSDASNANYSSTMVAEGPAVKEFESLQGTIREDDLELLWAVLRNAIKDGLLPEEVDSLVEIQVNVPGVVTRNRLEEVQIDRELYNLGAISKKTIAGRNDLDYEQELKNLAEERASNPQPPLPVGMGVGAGGFQRPTEAVAEAVSLARRQVFGSWGEGRGEYP